MAQALPLAKVAGLLVKTLAKPVSKRIKHEFSRSETTSRFLRNIGQFNHSVTSRLTIWSAGYKVRSIKPLEDDKALSAGADFVGETFILTVSVGVMLYEYNLSSVKSKAKEEKQRAIAKAERDDLSRKLHAIDVRLQAIENFVQQQSDSSNGSSTLTMLSTPLSVLTKSGQRPKYQAPDQREIVPIDDVKTGEELTQEQEQIEETKNNKIKVTTSLTQQSAIDKFLTKSTKPIDDDDDDDEANAGVSPTNTTTNEISKSEHSSRVTNTVTDSSILSSEITSQPSMSIASSNHDGNDTTSSKVQRPPWWRRWPWQWL